MGRLITVLQIIWYMGIFGAIAHFDGGNSPIRAVAAWGRRGLPSAESLAHSAAGKLADSPTKALSEGVPKAIELAILEQEIEDLNAMSKYDRRIERVLIVMPLTEQFDPPVGQFGQGHVQLSDRASIPKSIVKEVLRRKLDIPWQFEIIRAHRRGECDVGS